MNEPQRAFDRGRPQDKDTGCAETSRIGADVGLQGELTRIQQAMHCLALMGRVWPGCAESHLKEVLSQLGCGQAVGHSQAGDRIGRFEIIEPLGAGGGGVVYRARDTSLRRDVALKIPAPHNLVSADLRRRFIRESRLAASLKHPHLVSVYEVGEQGPICYIASELCDGPNLMQWLRQQTNPISPGWAAHCVAQLAEAIHYIHTRGILHRDLKPSNVLLEPREEAVVTINEACSDSSLVQRPSAFTPKITDFGLAKVLQSEGEQTKSGTMLGTPAYMAPEQAKGSLGDTGCATDVYALGCILYELLTGQAPYSGYSDVETLRQILARAPVVPRRLRNDIPRDLEAICLKCLEFEPMQRYASAHELQLDLNRYLSGRPVVARPSGIASQLMKWSRRRPIVAGLSIALLLAVVAGGVTASWQWRRTRLHYARSQAHFQMAHQAVQEMHRLIYKNDEFDAPEFHPLREEVVKLALKYYEQFQMQKGTDPGLLASIAGAYRDIGFLAHGSGSQVEAAKLYGKSQELWEQLVRIRPDNDEYWYFLASVRTLLAQVHVDNYRVEAAIPLLQDAMGVHERGGHYTSHPGAVANTLGILAKVYQDLRREADALQSAQEVVRLWEGITDAEPQNGHLRREMARAYAALGKVYSAFERPSEGMPWLRKAQAVQEELAGRDPEVPFAASNLAYTLRVIGDAQNNLEQSEEAMLSYKRACEIFTQISKTHPSNLGYQRKLAGAYLDLGTQQAELGQFDDAIRSHDAAILILKTLANVDSPSVNLRFQLAKAYALIGHSQSAVSRHVDAMRMFTLAQDMLKTLLTEQPDSTSIQNWMERVSRDISE